ncbi:hypothetical protein OG875_05990 [Streptomyces sp. NBC_01498]|uniref:hypothetical protein n=1 Tax=Streptomyces sp. NBC_01498 TaxID=2975870 RepID=UPI002E7B35DC|nr:hypothetical protein [Streptomyces sp. NBC_01498]WTL24200.1 hypothetical protein OG875_05990 [Streptomyces sp. NBC_01498]
MTAGEHGGYSSIRVRLSGGAAGNVDVHALRKWLERERGLEVLVGDEELSIYEQPQPDGGETGDDGPAMGAAMDIVLVLTGAVSPRLFDLLLAKTKSGVEAWRNNRRSVEPGDPPEVEITPIEPPGDGTTPIDPPGGEIPPIDPPEGGPGTRADGEE